METGGFAYREGQTVGANVAQDLGREPSTDELIQVEFDKPIKLVVPSVLRRNETHKQNAVFQLRFTHRVKGKLSVILDGNTVWSKTAQWLPERRILIPIAHQAMKASHIKLNFEEDEG